MKMVNITNTKAQIKIILSVLDICLPASLVDMRVQNWAETMTEMRVENWAEKMVDSKAKG